MENLEGFVAISGFWLCMLLIVLKKPVMAYIEKSKISNTDVDALNKRVEQLEGAVATIGKDVQEVKDTSDFAHKLLIDSAQQIADAHKLLTHNAQQMAEANKLLATRQDAPEPSIVSVVDNAERQPKLLGNEPKLLTTSTPLINELGKVIGEGTIRFERKFDVPMERVWQHLTASDCLEQWLAPGTIDQRFGGKVELRFGADAVPEGKDSGEKISGSVSVIEPLRTLAFSWNEADSDLQSSVCFKVTGEGDQTALELTHSQLPAERMAEFMARWHTYLDILKARLAELVPPDFKKRFREVLQTYVAVVATSVFVATAAFAPPAMAQPSNAIYQEVQVERSHILSRYDALARDADDLKRQISDLKRDASSDANQEVQRLERKLDNYNRDLHTLELDIRDLDRVLK